MSEMKVSLSLSELSPGFETCVFDVTVIFNLGTVYRHYIDWKIPVYSSWSVCYRFCTFV